MVACGVAFKRQHHDPSNEIPLYAEDSGWLSGLVTVLKYETSKGVTLLRSECKDEKLKKRSGKKRLLARCHWPSKTLLI